MKSLTKKQVANLNKLINSNNEYITTSVVKELKQKYSMTVEMLIHTKQESKSIFVTLNDELQFIAINGNHSLPKYLIGNVSVK